MKNIRVLIGMLGLDQHEVGAVAVADMLKNAGMEVIYAGKFNLPEMIVRTGIQEDIDVIGLSCHSWEYLYYLPELIGLLKEEDLNIPVIVGGSVITPEDKAKLIKMGVAAAFGPEATGPEIVEAIRNIAKGRKKW